MACSPRLHHLLLLAVATLFVVIPAQRVVAGMIEFAPVVDGDVSITRIDGFVTAVQVSTNSSTLRLGRPLSITTQFPVLEFDLSSLALGTIVVSATLELFTAVPGQNPLLSNSHTLLGYVGDGIITAADLGGSTLRVFHQSVVSGQPNDLDVTSFILGLPEGSIAGFSLAGGPVLSGSVYEYFSSEEANPDVHPRLILEVVPEPATLTLTIVGLTAMVLARRHSRASALAPRYDLS